MKLGDIIVEIYWHDEGLTTKAGKDLPPRNACHWSPWMSVGLCPLPTVSSKCVSSKSIPKGSMVLEYLPTLTPKVIQNNPNVGKYSIHGSLGIFWQLSGRWLSRLKHMLVIQHHHLIFMNET